MRIVYPRDFPPLPHSATYHDNPSGKDQTDTEVPSGTPRSGNPKLSHRSSAPYVPALQTELNQLYTWKLLLVSSASDPSNDRLSQVRTVVLAAHQVKELDVSSLASPRDGTSRHRTHRPSVLGVK